MNTAINEHKVLNSFFQKIFSAATEGKASGDEKQAARDDISHAKIELEVALNNFNNVVDPQLIDLFIYEIQAAQTRYDHLLRKFKAAG